MKVRLYKNKKLIENTSRPMGLQEPLMYAFSAKTADYAFTEGEEIPSEISSEYVMMETEVDDAELNKTYSDAKAEGYQGDITAVAKLMAMGIPLNVRAAVDVIPTSNIPYDMIRDSLNAAGGTVNNNTWTAFSSAANIKKWAAYKPFPYKQDFFATQWESEWASGLKVSEMKKHGQFAYFELEQVLPKGGPEEPYRLGDFRGYNRNAQTPALTKGNVGWVGAPDEATGYVPANSNTATVHLKVTHPDISPFKTPHPSEFGSENNKVSIWTYYGTEKKTVYSELYDSIASFEPVKNKTIEVQFSQDFNIPTMGYTSNQLYYLAICGCEVANFTAVIYKEFIQRPTDPESWFIAKHTLPSEWVPQYIGVQNFKYLRTSNPVKPDEFYGAQINNLWCLVGGFATTVHIDAKNPSNGAWLEIVRIDIGAFNELPSGSGFTYMNGTNTNIHNGGLTRGSFTNSNNVKVNALSGNLRLDKSKFSAPPTEFQVRVIKK